MNLEKTADKSGDDNVDITVPILATVVCIALLIIAAIAAIYIKRRGGLPCKEKVQTDNVPTVSTVPGRICHHFLIIVSLTFPFH